MAYKVVKAKGSIYGLTYREFIVDTAAEITDLPTNKKMGKAQTGDTVSDEMCAPGSIATVTENGDVYELSASSTWTKKPAQGSGDEPAVEIDSSLTQEGKAADAKAVGDALVTKVDTTALSGYVQSSTAESTYAKKSEISDFMTSTVADGKYATKTELGSYVKTVDLPKGVAVTDATSAEDVVQQLNALITSLENAGLIATS